MLVIVAVARFMAAKYLAGDGAMAAMPAIDRLREKSALAVRR
jgi:hypothetical protein